MNVVTAVRSPAEREPGSSSQSELYGAPESRPQGAGQLLWVTLDGGEAKG